MRTKRRKNFQVKEKQSKCQKEAAPMLPKKIVVVKALKSVKKKRIKTQKKHFHILKHCQNHPNVQKNPLSCQTKKKVIKALKSAQKRNKEVKKKAISYKSKLSKCQKESPKLPNKKGLDKSLKKHTKRNKK